MCNIIFYLISVFAFSFVTLSGATTMIFQTYTQILVVTSPPTSYLNVARGHTSFCNAAYAIHVITLHSSMPSMQFMRLFRRGHLRPVYFKNQIHFLLFLFLVFFQQATHAISTVFPPGSTYGLFILGIRCISCYFRSQCLTFYSMLLTQFTRHLKMDIQVNIQQYYSLWIMT